MLIKNGCDNAVGLKRCCCACGFGGHTHCGYEGRSTRGVVLTELLVVLAIITMMIGMAMFSIDRLYGNTKFRRKAREFMNVVQLAVNSAAESENRYVITIDLVEQTYSLHQLVTYALEDEPIITEGEFSDIFQCKYILFDDGIDTRYPGENEVTDKMFLRAGHAGWESGAIIVLSDIDKNLYSVVLNRLNRTVSMYDGALELADCGFLETKKKNELPFQ
jgi:type II secretory pathway pseudopilin PulG